MLVDVPWLLRRTRLHAPRTQGRVGRAVAQGWGVAKPVHRAQVTRWESGATAVTYDIVRRYEDVCGLRRHQLVTAIDLLYRNELGRAPAPQLRRPDVEDPVPETVDMLTELLDAAPVTGDQWDRLSLLLGQLPAALLLPRDWSSLVRRGIEELDVSIGMAYLQRAEAMARICSHPRAADSVVEVVGDILTDPATQIHAEAAALLQFTLHPQVGRLLADVVKDPVNDKALRAALFASASEVRRGQTQPEDALETVRAAHDLAVDAAQSYPVRRAAADVLLALRPEARSRIARNLDPAAGDESVASIVKGAGPLGDEPLAALQRRLFDRIGDLLGDPVGEDAGMRALVSAITTETNDDRRSHALHLLMVAPFGPTFGRACLAELGDAAASGDTGLAHEVLGMLLCLTPADDLHLLLDLTTGSDQFGRDNPEVAAAAAFAIGNAKFAPVDTAVLADRLGSAVSRALTGTDQAPHELVRAWAYALGRFGLLDRVHAPARRGGEADVVRVWTQAEQWWRGLPAPVLAAARE